MENLNIKNIHFLYMYPKIAKYFKAAVDKANKGDVEEGFDKLRKCLEALLKELTNSTVLGKEWYKNSVKNKQRPNNEAMITYLYNNDVINEKQYNLLNSIRWLANKYVHGEADEQKEKDDLESLKNFCIRLDKELPSLMAHLGIGGASRKQYLNTEDDKKNIKTSKSSTDYYSQRRKIQDEIRDYINNPNSYSNSKSNKANNQSTNNNPKDIKDIFSQFSGGSSSSTSTTYYNEPQKKTFINKIENLYKTTPVFLVRFVIVLVLTVFMFTVTFNKKASNKLLDRIDDVVNRNNKLLNEYSTGYSYDYAYFSYLSDSVENGMRNGVSLSFAIPNKKLNVMTEICNNIKFIGKNGEGTISYLNQDGYLQLYTDEKIEIYVRDKLSISAKQMLNNSSVSSYDYELIYSKQSGLSNGDVVTVSIPQDAIDTLDFYNISFDSTSTDIVVDGLYDEQVITDNKDDIISQLESLMNSKMLNKSNDYSSFSSSINKIYYMPPNGDASSGSIVAYSIVEQEIYPNILNSHTKYTYYLGRYSFNTHISNGIVQITTEIDQFGGFEPWIHTWYDSVQSVSSEIAKDLETVDKGHNAITIK